MYARFLSPWQSIHCIKSITHTPVAPGKAFPWHWHCRSPLHKGRRHREKVLGTNSACYDGIPMDGGEKNLTNSLVPKFYSSIMEEGMRDKSALKIIPNYPFHLPSSSSATIRCQGNHRSTPIGLWCWYTLQFYYITHTNTHTTHTHTQTHTLKCAIRAEFHWRQGPQGSPCMFQEYRVSSWKEVAPVTSLLHQRAANDPEKQVDTIAVSHSTSLFLYINFAHPITISLILQMFPSTKQALINVHVKFHLHHSKRR